MTTGPPQSPVTEGVRSLEVRWIFPGQLEAAVAGWFGRFPATAESREDTYLLEPQLPGLSVKVRGSRALEVKAYRGSPGLLEVAGRARGRLESWQKWSFPFSPLSPGSGDPPGWRPVGKKRRISRFSLASGQIVARAPGPGQQPRCEVELTEVHAAARTGGPSGSRRPAPPVCSAPRSRPPPRSCSPIPCPAGWNPARMTLGPTRSGSASGRVTRVTPTPEECPPRPPRITIPSTRHTPVSHQPDSSEGIMREVSAQNGRSSAARTVMPADRDWRRDCKATV